MIEIAYGPQHRARVEAAIGQPIPWPVPIIDQSVYSRPYWKAMALADGRVSVEVDRGYSGLLTIFPDRAAFEAWKRARLASVACPEWEPSR